MVFVARSTATADGPGWTGAAPTRAEPKDPEPDDAVGMLSRLTMDNGLEPCVVARAEWAGCSTRPAEADATGAWPMTAASKMASSTGKELSDSSGHVAPP